MRTVTHYQIVSNSLRNKLVEKVTQLIADGWQPLGGVSNGEQAMVKYSDDDLYYTIKDAIFDVKFPR